MQNKKLLVITDGFPQISSNKYNCNFVKSYVDLVRHEFNQVFVISPQPYFPSIFNKIKLFKNFVRYSGFTDYTYQNVKVFYPSFLTLPLERFRQNRGDYFTQKCEEIIQKNNLKFDLIHTHFLFPSAYAGIQLKKKYQKPVIATAHGSDTYKDPFVNHSNFKRTKKIFSNIDLITVQSQFLEGIIQKINSKTKIKIISNFVDTKLFSPTTQKKDKIKTILMVNNLIESKGILDIVPTVQKLLQLRQDFVFKIIGHGHLENILKQQITENKLEKYIKVLGPKQNQEIVKYYNEADIFFFPSRAENFPIVQLESLACGVPIVAAPNEGSKYILNDSLGYLAKDFNTKEYAELLNKALNKNWNYKEMRNYILNNFSQEKVKTKMLNVYKKN